MNFLKTCMLIVIQCTIIMNAADQFYLWNKTGGPVDVAYKSSREMKTMSIPAGSQSFLGFNPQQMTITTTNNGFCSYFSGIGMNGIYSIVNIVPWGMGAALQFTGKTRQSVELTPVFIKPDMPPAKCLKRLQNRSRSRENRQFSFSIQNLTTFPATVELDLGNETRVIPNLQAKGSTGSVVTVGTNIVVYNIRIYSRDGSCTTINNIGMNPWFNLLQIDFDNGRYVVKYTHTGAVDSKILWDSSIARPVAFTVSSNASLGDSEYKANCWNPNLDI